MNIIKNLTGRFTKGAVNSRKLIIVHHTASGNATLNSILRFFRLSNAVSIHYVVGREGEIVQMVDENNVAWHCGKSEWKGFTDINNCSIGIEVLSDGKSYTDAQRLAVKELCLDIMERNNIIRFRVLRHADVALPRGRKSDISFPFYEKFNDWTGFQKSLIRDI